MTPSSLPSHCPSSFVAVFSPVVLLVQTDGKSRRLNKSAEWSLGSNFYRCASHHESKPGGKGNMIVAEATIISTVSRVVGTYQVTKVASSTSDSPAAEQARFCWPTPPGGCPERCPEPSPDLDTRTERRTPRQPRQTVGPFPHSDGNGVHIAYQGKGERSATCGPSRVHLEQKSCGAVERHQRASCVHPHPLR